MQSFQQTQQNEFDQLVGVSIEAVQFSESPATTLIGQQVSLDLIVPSNIAKVEVEQLWDCINTEPDLRCWTYLPYAGFDGQAHLEAMLSCNFSFVGAAHYLIKLDQQAVGWVALLNPRPTHRVIEIGNVYFSAAMKQSIASTETIFLLLAQCFEQGYRRVEWKCDELNQPSYRAALRYGFQYEGTFRQDRIAKGHNRNTAWFSILDEEWPQLQQAYRAWLKADNFDAQGQQKQRLADFIKGDQR